MSKQKKTTIYVKGMHCPSCDILVKDKFKNLGGITDVKADYRNCSAQVTYTGNLDKTKLNQSIEKYGYSVVDKDELNESTIPFSRRIIETGVIAMILFVLYFIAQDINLIPSFSNGGGKLTLGAAFIVGLVASVSSCMATSGALFLATIGKLKKQTVSVSQNMIPAINFNVGRVVSYTVFGYVIGLLGQSVAQKLQFGTYLTLFVAIAMILVALDMLKLVRFTAFMPQTFTKRLFENLQKRFMHNPKQTAFFLGAITYLLPCGFTQSVQLFALGLANPVQSALMMGVFALGTTPALLAIGYASSFTKSRFYPLFSQIIGVVVFFIGVSYFLNFLTLQGVTMSFLPSSKTTDNIAAQGADPAIKMENGKQVIEMSVTSRGYTPEVLTVKQGIPVKWVVKGVDTLGCQGSLLAPQANIPAPVAIKTGDNIFEFTPKEKGIIAFSCSMGMFRGQFNVI